MSISTLQEKFFNKGCGTVIMGLAAIAMVATMFTRNSGSSSQSQNGDATGNAVVSVGSVPVPADLIQARATELQTQILPPSAGAPNATTQAQFLAMATGDIVRRAAVQALLEKSPPTDAEMKAFVESQMDELVAQLRSDLEKQGKVKPGASDADLEKAAKDVLKGKTLAAFRSETETNFLKQYGDPKTKPAILEKFGPQILIQREGSKKIGNDQSLRDSYKTFIVRRIFLGDVSGSKDTAATRAGKAEADLKAGKSFTAEMDALSNDAPEKGKKISDSTQTIPATASEVAGLVGKAPGATTGIVDTAGGKAIYQLVSVAENLPKDFEKNKGQIRAARLKGLGAAEVEKQVKAFIATDSVKWESVGYQALNVTSQAMQPIGQQVLIFDTTAQRAAVAAAEAALKSPNPANRKLGAQALLLATDPKMLAVKPADSAKTRQEALEAAQTVGIVDAALSLELVDLYANAKDGAKTTATLISASKANTRYDAEGERSFRDIAAKALELQKRGVLTKEGLESVQAQQALWTAARTDESKVAAQTKTDSASQAAANAAELARQKAEEEANAAPKPKDSDAAGKAANDAELARQKAETTKPTPPAGKAPAGKTK